MNKLSKRERFKYIKKINKLENELSKCKRILKNNGKSQTRKTYLQKC